MVSLVLGLLGEEGGKEGSVLKDSKKGENATTSIGEGELAYEKDSRKGRRKTDFTKTKAKRGKRRGCPKPISGESFRPP